MIHLWDNNMNSGITSFKFTFLNNVSCHMHINYSVELLIVFDGCVRVQIHENEYLVKNNEVILIKSMYPHDFETISEESSGLIISFSPSLHEDFISTIKDFRFKRETTQLSPAHISYIKDLITRREVIYPQNLSDINTILFSITNEILYENNLIPDKHANDSLAITKAIEYITEHYNEDIHLDDLAKKLGINKTYASQIFPKYMNLTFHDALNSIRINHATKMLRNKKNSISDIAYQCGYGSIRTFNRIYKKYLNITPSQFRKDNSLYPIAEDKIDYFS